MLRSIFKLMRNQIVALQPTTENRKIFGAVLISDMDGCQQLQRRVVEVSTTQPIHPYFTTFSRQLSSVMHHMHAWSTNSFSVFKERSSKHCGHICSYRDQIQAVTICGSA